MMLSLQREQQLTVKEGTRFAVEQCGKSMRYEGERYLNKLNTYSLEKSLNKANYLFCTALFVTIPQMMEKQFITTLLQFCFPYVTELTLCCFPFLFRLTSSEWLLAFLPS